MPASSKTRNKLIAKAFKESGLIEQYGSGIMRIRRLCSDYGLKDPLFQEMQQGFKVTLYKVGDKVGETLTQNQKLILDKILQNNRISATELSENIPISKRKIEENLAKLKQKGILKRVGSTKGGYWEILVYLY